ncbi:MAG: hypothetical protein AVDCRST_MAG58-1780 [uncultured Rubrobacteraceae bacterium]|uniref:Uncharacterized protein n=1 Tax=uncultured Rubrobacteraceae bacterium TaxID=349277 RepID=A0A6J4R296_9ACTN|nr:MAG: hypothetical protein AVDCRST_MAG58-1780 [uncultured Rubrobacteraceae bacterium]
MNSGDLHGRQKALADRQYILFLISASFCSDVQSSSKLLQIS